MNYDIQKLSDRVDELANAVSWEVDEVEANSLSIDLRAFFRTCPDGQTLSQKYAVIFPARMLHEGEVSCLCERANWQKFQKILNEYRQAVV